MKKYFRINVVDNTGGNMNVPTIHDFIPIDCETLEEAEIIITLQLPKHEYEVTEVYKQK